MSLVGVAFRRSPANNSWHLQALRESGAHSNLAKPLECARIPPLSMRNLPGRFSPRFVGFMLLFFRVFESLHEPSAAEFPLTPALSLREREKNRSQPLAFISLIL